MRIFKSLASILFIILSSCNVNTTKKVHTPILGEPLNKTPLFAEMQIENTIKIGRPLILKFTVYNQGASTQKFCKWHTPFEPLMSKYLEIKDENGVEMMYRGAMVKRIMPPPESSYIKVSKKDSISATVDLLKAFAITDPSKYTVSYTGQDMSGVLVKKSVVFDYVR
jgi:hypothetical protein